MKDQKIYARNSYDIIMKLGYTGNTDKQRKIMEMAKTWKCGYIINTPQTMRKLYGDKFLPDGKHYNDYTPYIWRLDAFSYSGKIDLVLLIGTPFRQCYYGKFPFEDDK
jgi:hypothetical protein